MVVSGPWYLDTADAMNRIEFDAFDAASFALGHNHVAALVEQ
jgi:hypothetical protein